VSKTWAMKVEATAKLELMERLVVRWMCGIYLKGRTASAELNNQLAIACITHVVRRCRLRWFSHGERKDSDDWVSACSFQINGVRHTDRARKTLNECVKKDLVELGLRRE